MTYLHDKEGFPALCFWPSRKLICHRNERAYWDEEAIYGIL